MSEEEKMFWISVILVVLPLLVYFLPSFVAFARRHRQRVAIFLLNFLLGWTILGWIIALVWAATTDVERRPAGRKAPDPSSPAPRDRSGQPDPAERFLSGAKRSGAEVQSPER